MTTPLCNPLNVSLGDGGWVTQSTFICIYICTCTDVHAPIRHGNKLEMLLDVSKYHIQVPYASHRTIGQVYF